MKTQTIILSISVIALAIAIYIGFRVEHKNLNLLPGTHEVIVKEVVQTSSYTYVRVSEANNEYWCALNKSEVATGKTFYWLKGWEMNQFHSKELNKTFASIFFLESLTDAPPVQAENSIPENMAIENPATGGSMPGRQFVKEKERIKLEKAKDGITIAELFANKQIYNGKVVKIRGEVVKISPAIMDRNWIHIQDGTKEGANYDLTITTLDSTSIGNVVIAEGIISLDKNIGAGYNYEVLMENAKLK
jgi:hypothetical protein